MQTFSPPTKTLDISIAGEINLDLILYGLPEVMPVERELLGTDFQVTLGSSSAILAHNLAVLGAHVGFVTLVGEDPLGKIALARLGESGADVSRVRVDKGGTTGVTLVLPHGTPRHILTYPGTMATMRLADLDIDYLKSAKHFHLSSLFLLHALKPDLPALFKELKEAGLTISLDTNDDPSGKWGGVLPELLDYVDLLLPNEGEACRMTRKNTFDEALAELAQRVPCIALKCGSRGSVVRVAGETFTVAGVPVKPMDTIGAGDSFNAGFLFGWLKGWPPDQCAYAGNITGALSTLRVGGTEAFRDRDLVRSFLQLHSFPGTVEQAVTQSGGKIDDNFMAMVSAKAEVTLPLSQFQPQSTLVTAEHPVERARFPVVDYHNHLDALDPVEVLRIMDACGIERIVNITMKTGDEAIRMMDKFRRVDAERFATIGWMDWSGVEKDDFNQLTFDRLEKLVEHGAKGIKFWKNLGLSVRDRTGALLRVDDERLAPIFDKAAELGIPVMFHIADPDAFFLPVDGRNERFEELAAHPDWSFHRSQFSKKELLDQRDRVIARHPKTTFVAAHVAECGENLARATQLLENHPNVLLDISARASELGRQPYSSRALFLRFPDRILFGSDLVPEESMYRLYFRFLETADEYFDYPSHASRQGRWQIQGLYLPDEVLRKVYRENALRLLS